MDVPKAQVLALLRNRGEHDEADKAERELPDLIDTDRDAGCSPSSVSIRPS